MSIGQLNMMLPNRSKGAIGNRRLRLGLPALTPKQPDLSSSKDLYYILGVVLGDGSVGKEGRNYTIKLNQTEKDFAQTFKSALTRIGLHPSCFTVERPPPSKKLQYVVKANSIIFHKWFKSLTLRDIERMVGQRDDFMISFVKGLYESDGGVSYYKPNHRRIDFYSNKRELLELAQRLLRHLGFRPKLYSRARTGGFKPRPNFLRWQLRLVGNPQTDRFLGMVKPCIKNEVR